MLHTTRFNNKNLPGTFQILNHYRAGFDLNASPDTGKEIFSDENDKNMPDRLLFKDFFNSKVKEGEEMTLEQFKVYPIVRNLLADSLVKDDDMYDLWISAVGDSAGLNADEGYEMLCMVSDLPDPEDASFLDSEFEKLSGNKNKLSFFNFINWSDVQDMQNEEVLSMEEISNIWRSVVGDFNSFADRRLFGILNNELDELIDNKETMSKKTDDSSSGDDLIVTPSDVWKPGFDSSSVFDKESLQEITDFFNEEAKSKFQGKGITLDALLAWEDIKQFIAEGSLTVDAVKDVWDEAPKRKVGKVEYADFEAFKRINVRLDMVMDDIEESKAQNSLKSNPTNVALTPVVDFADAEQFYRTEFSRMTKKGKLLPLKELLEWNELKELMNDNAVNEKQIARMFESMPKEKIGTSEIYGIAEDTFVAFNGMLDVMLDSSTSTEKAVAPAPSSLISAESRPMPKSAELKLGSLGAESEKGDEASTGLTEEELQMMKTLDKADNMLNSGSFGDFDQLIGDVNDPRLAALVDQNMANVEAVDKKLQDIIDELLQLGRKQSRCGMDPAPEEEAARIRDLIQAVIEKSPKAASRDITNLRESLNGDWRMLYSNSEMFQFYNGITGLVNVFPGSKFNDLSLQYASDGYLNEAKYFEELVTPLGKTVATAFSNWDMVKEMSFMTNENSVVLRAFCTKVIAGPFEYQAEENWKSLRTMSMNELLYVDERIALMRNYGALRVFFVLERK